MQKKNKYIRCASLVPAYLLFLCVITLLVRAQQIKPGILSSVSVAERILVRSVSVLLTRHAYFYFLHHPPLPLCAPRFYPLTPDDRPISLSVSLSLARRSAFFRIPSVGRSSSFPSFRVVPNFSKTKYLIKKKTTKNFFINNNLLSSFINKKLANLNSRKFSTKKKKNKEGWNDLDESKNKKKKKINKNTND